MKRRGKAAVITAAIVVQLGGYALVAMSLQDLTEAGADEGGPEPTYEIRLRESLEGAGLELAEGENVHHVREGLSEGSYENARGNLVLHVIATNYPYLKDGDEADELLKEPGSRTTGPGTRPPRDFRPSGAKDPVRCAVTADQDPVEGTVSNALCAWDDNGSAALVLDLSDTALVTSAGKYDLAALAAHTTRIRTAIREPTGAGD